MTVSVFHLDGKRGRLKFQLKERCKNYTILGNLSTVESLFYYLHTLSRKKSTRPTEGNADREDPRVKARVRPFLVLEKKEFPSRCVSNFRVWRLQTRIKITRERHPGVRSITEHRSRHFQDSRDSSLSTTTLLNSITPLSRICHGPRVVATTTLRPIVTGVVVVIGVRRWVSRTKTRDTDRL